MPPRRLITEPNLQDSADNPLNAYGWQAPPPPVPWYDGLGDQIAALATQEARRFTATLYSARSRVCVTVYAARALFRALR